MKASTITTGSRLAKAIEQYELDLRIENGDCASGIPLLLHSTTKDYTRIDLALFLMTASKHNITLESLLRALIYYMGYYLSHESNGGPQENLLNEIKNLNQRFSLENEETKKEVIMSVINDLDAGKEGFFVEAISALITDNADLQDKIGVNTFAIFKSGVNSAKSRTHAKGERDPAKYRSAGSVAAHPNPSTGEKKKNFAETYDLGKITPFAIIGLKNEEIFQKKDKKEGLAKNRTGQESTIHYESSRRPSTDDILTELRYNGVVGRPNKKKGITFALDTGRISSNVTITWETN